MIMIVFKVYAHFIRKNNLVVVTLRIVNERKDLLLVGIFERCRPCYSGTQTKHVSRFAFKGVGISGNIRTRPDKGHVADEDIPQLGQFVEFVFAQYMPQRRDTVLSCHRYVRTAMIYDHRAKLIHRKDLTVSPYPPLSKNHRAVRHPDFD